MGDRFIAYDWVNISKYHGKFDKNKIYITMVNNYGMRGILNWFHYNFHASLWAHPL
jgi:hypothetical protein